MTDVNVSIEISRPAGARRPDITRTVDAMVERNATADHRRIEELLEVDA